MGGCLSKKSDVNRKDVIALKSKSVDEAPEKIITSVVKTEQKKTEDVKKEICVTKHRKSHDKQIQTEQKQSIQMQSRVDNIAIGTPVRTSSCTREEVDAILIQCGRLSWSSSANTPVEKKYSGSKRSYDFDAEVIVGKVEEDELEKERKSRSRSSPSKPRRRRTTLSRERDSNQQRSGSRERIITGSGRRVSRSPGRRSSTPVESAIDATNGASKPGKLVSVPASLTSSIAAGNEQSIVKKIAVKRDVKSPRSQSPSQLRQPPPQQLPTLSRSYSKKTDQSPYRRNPLTEIDNNHSSQVSFCFRISLLAICNL